MPASIKHVISIHQLGKKRISSIIEQALQLKKDRQENLVRPPLNKSIGLIFMKPSMRTRLSFEVGAFELGCNVSFIRNEDIQIGSREPIQDIVRVLERYYQGLVLRVFHHKDILDFSTLSHIPIINGLSHLEHPCQILADYLTLVEHNLHRKKIVYIGDCNNIFLSWVSLANLFNLNYVACIPKQVMEDPDNRRYFDERNTNKCTEIISSPQEAVKDASVIYTDVWASMGTQLNQERIDIFKGYSVDSQLMSQALPNARFLHCLPAQRGYEVSDEILEGDQSLVFEQAENRLHIHKAILEDIFK